MEDYTQVETLDKLAKRNARADITIAVPTDTWTGMYSIQIIKANRPIRDNTMERCKSDDGTPLSRLKTTVRCSLNIRTMFAKLLVKTSAHKSDFTIGDITNEFLSIFDLIHGDARIDVQQLNIFLKKYYYPPIDNKSELAQGKEMLWVSATTDGTSIEKGFSGRKKENVRYFPIESHIVEYVCALQSLYFEIMNARFPKCDYIFDVQFLNVYKRETKTNQTQILQESLNGILLFDASNAISKYSFKKCPICKKKYFFQNRKQSYCRCCKPLSKMTKSEMIEQKLESEKLSNNYRRESFKRGLNRRTPKLTTEQKNELLIKNGFAPITRKNGRR